MPRLNEHRIGIATLQILAENDGGTATIAQIKEGIPEFVALSEEDSKQSETRPNEEMWEQQVRNLVSHRTVEGNIIAEGFAQYSRGRLTITEAGRQRLKNASLL